MPVEREVDIIDAEYAETGRGGDQPERVRIRPGTGRDVPGITVLCHQLGYPASPEEVQQRLEPILCGEQHALFVAVAPGGALLGWIHGYVCHLVEVEPHVEIGGLVVDEVHRQLGIGRLLLEHVEAWSAKKGCSAMRLRSNVVREDAHRFYVDLGYRIVKTQLAFRKELG